MRIGQYSYTSAKPPEPTSSQTPPSRFELWRSRLSRERLRELRTPAKRAGLFVAGVLVAFSAILLYQVLFPGPHQLTTSDVKTSIAQAFASVTPAPAFSESVYEAVQP